MAALSFARSEPTPLLQSARTVNRSRPEDRRCSFEKRLTGVKVDAGVDFFMRGITLSPLGKREQTKARNPSRADGLADADLRRRDRCQSGVRGAFLVFPEEPDPRPDTRTPGIYVAEIHAAHLQ